MLAVPTESKSITIHADCRFESADALRDERIGWVSDVLIEGDRLAPVSDPAAHALLLSAWYANKQKTAHPAARRPTSCASRSSERETWEPSGVAAVFVSTRGSKWTEVEVFPAAYVSFRA